MSKYKKYNHFLRNILDICGFTKSQEKIVKDLWEDFNQRVIQAKSEGKFIELLEEFLSTNMEDRPRETAYVICQALVDLVHCPGDKCVTKKMPTNLPANIKVVQLTPELIKKLPEELQKLILGDPTLPDPKKNEDIN